MDTERPVELVSALPDTAPPIPPGTPIDAPVLDHRAQQLLGQAAYAAVLTGQPERVWDHLAQLPDDALEEVAVAGLDLAHIADELRRAVPDGTTPPPPITDVVLATLRERQNADLKANILERTAGHDAAFAALAQQNVAIDSSIMTSIQLGQLVEHLLGDLDQPGRLGYELRVRDKFDAVLADIHTQLRRARLTAGVAGVAALPPINGIKP